MKYICNLVSLKSLLVSPNGVFSPLCCSCSNESCENPIERRKVSVFGIIKEMKVFVQREEESCVVECDGFISDKI